MSSTKYVQVLGDLGFMCTPASACAAFLYLARVQRVSLDYSGGDLVAAASVSPLVVRYVTQGIRCSTTFSGLRVAVCIAYARMAASLGIFLGC